METMHCQSTQGRSTLTMVRPDEPFFTVNRKDFQVYGLFLVVILISQEQKECALRGELGEIAEGYIAGRYLRLGNNS